MKNQDSSYAQLRIGFYENRFQNQTIQQLVDNLISWPTLMVGRLNVPISLWH